MRSSITKEDAIKITIKGTTFNVIDDYADVWEFWKGPGDGEASSYFPDYWNRVNSGSWEADTFEILSKVLRCDRSYMDIGAWIGATCLYGCRLAKKCWAFEPDPVAYDILAKNVQANDFPNITALPVAIFDKNGQIQIGSPGHYLGDSCTSYLATERNPTMVKAITLQEMFDDHKIEDCNFIKMDVEGAEKVIIPSIVDLLNNFKINLLVGLHAPLFQDKEEYFDSIIGPLSRVYDKAFFGSVDGKTTDIANHHGFDNVYLQF